MPLFDAYLIVDWSASSAPKTGRDSIWWCLVQTDKGAPQVRKVNNPDTREQAVCEIREVMLRFAQSNLSLLVGFDFAYGYPKGFAQLIASTPDAPWLALWRELAKRVEDQTDNRNNRFQVAAELNRMISGRAAPFWGCPRAQCSVHLGMTRPREHTGPSLPEFRIAERKVRAHSTWKLFYPGSVGSQVLVGLPRVFALRTDPDLARVSCIWPFETGLNALDRAVLGTKRIVHAEIYPSILPVKADRNEVLDQAQVRGLALHFAGLDQEERLARLFAGDTRLRQDQRRLVESEEGWILGVT